jgi:ribonuclease III
MGSINKRARDEEDARSDDNSRRKYDGRVETSQKMETSSNKPAAGVSNDYVASLLAQARASGLLPAATTPNLQSLGTLSPFHGRNKLGSGRIPKYSDQTPKRNTNGFENDRKRRKLEYNRRSPVRPPSPNKPWRQHVQQYTPAKFQNKSPVNPNQKAPGISAVDPKYVETIISEALRHPTGPNAPSQNSIPKFPSIPKPENYPPPLPPIHDKEIEKLCFTHRSYSHDPNHRDITANTMNYERLEFLGDSYMNYCVTKLLYKALPFLREGELTRFRSQLVSNDNIRHYAMMYGFKDRILLGSGAEKDELREEGKAVADIFEAYIGGILTDQPDTGEAVVYNWMAEITAPQISETEKIAAKIATLNKGAKQELYVLLDADKMPAPTYVITKLGSTTLDFEVACLVMGKEMGRGVGKNKNDAGTRAAMQVIDKLRAAKTIQVAKDQDIGEGKRAIEKSEKSSSEEEESDDDSLSEGEIAVSD